MNEHTTVIRRLPTVAVLAVVLLLAASCGGSKKTTSTSAVPTGTTATSPVPTPTPKPNKGLTIRTADGTHNFYPLITGKTNLVGYSTGQVEGPKVRILSIVAPDAFWIGKGPNMRVLVHIRLKGQPTPNIHAGQNVGIIGQLTESPQGAANTLGVKDAASKSMLDREGAYVEVSIGDLKLG
jgi:hypothetical protein